MKKTISIWVARDRDGSLYVYGQKPIKNVKEGTWDCGNCFLVDSTQLEGVQWEDDEPTELAASIVHPDGEPEAEECEQDLTKYRPFSNLEECFREMSKHSPFGWIKDITGYLVINSVYDRGVYIPEELNLVDFVRLLHDFEFADGTPLGIKKC